MRACHRISVRNLNTSPMSSVQSPTSSFLEMRNIEKTFPGVRAARQCAVSIFNAERFMPL